MPWTPNGGTRWVRSRCQTTLLKGPDVIKGLSKKVPSSLFGHDRAHIFIFVFFVFFFSSRWLNHQRPCPSFFYPTRDTSSSSSLALDWNNKEKQKPVLLFTWWSSVGCWDGECRPWRGPLVAEAHGDGSCSESRARRIGWRSIDGGASRHPELHSPRPCRGCIF